MPDGPVTLPLFTLLFVALNSVGQAVQADDKLTQTTISFYAGGKPVGGVALPVGTPSAP